MLVWTTVLLSVDICICQVAGTEGIVCLAGWRYGREALHNGVHSLTNTSVYTRFMLNVPSRRPGALCIGSYEFFVVISLPAVQFFAIATSGYKQLASIQFSRSNQTHT